MITFRGRGVRIGWISCYVVDNVHLVSDNWFDICAFALAHKLDGTIEDTMIGKSKSWNSEFIRTSHEGRELACSVEKGEVRMHM